MDFHISLMGPPGVGITTWITRLTTGEFHWDLPPTPAPLSTPYQIYTTQRVLNLRFHEKQLPIEALYHDIDLIVECYDPRNGDRPLWNGATLNIGMKADLVENIQENGLWVSALNNAHDREFLQSILVGLGYGNDIIVEGPAVALPTIE